MPALLTPAQMEAFRTELGIRPGHEWDKFEAMAHSESELTGFIRNAPYSRLKQRRREASRTGRCSGRPAGAAAG